MDRRNFLGLTVGSLVTAGCGGGGGKSTPSPNTQLQTLASKMTGKLIQPSDVDYHHARVVYNSRFDDVMPMAVARCASPEDVIAVLAFAKQNNVPITPRCGGHGYAGYSTTTGIVIDVTPMSAITIGAGTATIGAGARLVDVYDQLTAHGVAIPAGSCESVGIAGLTMGGGIGIVDRAYGLTCDNLISVDIVTADGKKLTCSETVEPDLFWALRGGGGGNFGVVTSFTFKTHVTSDITTLEATFNFDDLEKVMAAWQVMPQYLPDSIWAQTILNWSDGSLSVYVRAFCVGSQDDAKPYWNRFLGETLVTPTWTNMVTGTYRQTMLGACGNLNVQQCHVSDQFSQGLMSRNAFAATSDFYAQAVPDDGLKALKKFISDSFAERKLGMIILDLMGGVIDNFAPDDTAFVHRNAIFSAEYYTYYPLGTPVSTIVDAQAWLHSFRALMKPWTTGRAYVNYIDPLIDDWKTAYYGDNYARLAQVKAKYDPAWLFKMPQGVQPT